jgi:hypothetical protein
VALDLILHEAKVAVISIGARLAFVFLASALSSSDGFALGEKPDLALIVFGAGSDTRPITAPGQLVSFRIGLDNKNAVDAHRIKLTAALPIGLKFQSSDPPPTRVESGNHLVWEIDTLDPKALPRFFEVTAETEANLATGSRLEILAEAESSEGNANPDDNHASYTVYVQPTGPALVFLDSTLDSVPLTTDGSAAFNVNLKNAGNLPAIDTRLEATLPKEVRFDKADPQPESSNGQVVNFKLGDLARAESRSIVMTVKFDPHRISDVLQSDPPLTFAFRISHISSGAEVTDSHLEITKHIESAGQDVAVWLTSEGAKELGEVSPNDDLTCVITYANLGNQPAHKVAVALNLGSGLAITHSDPQPSGTGTNNGYPGGVMHWDIGDLDVGMSRTIHSVIHIASVPDDGALVSATITADGIDIDSSNNTACLLWHRPLSSRLQGRLASHRWRHLFGLILVIAVVLILSLVRTRRRLGH